MGGGAIVVPKSAFYREALELPLHLVRHKSVGQPRRITDKDIRAVGLAGKPRGAGDIADVVAPDMVTPLFVEFLQAGKVRVEYRDVVLFDI